MEPIKDVFVRIGSFLGELDMNQNILIVSHGGLMRAMMYYIKTNGKEDNDKFLEFSFATQIKNAQIFKLQSCGTFELVR